MIVYLSVFVAFLGALVYMLSANPKFQELGRVSFFAGMLAFLICVCEHGGKVFGIAAQ